MVLAFIGPCNDQYVKMMASGPILVGLIYFGVFLGKISQPDDWRKLDSVAIFVLGVSFIGFMIEMKYPSLFPDQAHYRENLSFSGIFPEPSVVAFSLFPAIAILLCSHLSRSRKLGVIFLIGLLIFSRSSTLIALTIAFVLYRLSLKKFNALNIFFFLIFAIGSFGLILMFDEYFTPFLERVNSIYLGEDATNLSSMVYLQGMQDAHLNFLRTYGLGLGLNMMGCNPLPDSFFRDVIDSGGGLSLNSQDGSFLVSKIISEFGIFGIIFYICITIIFFKNELFASTLSSKNIRQIISIQSSIVFIFLAISILRSTGYFSGTFLLLIVSLSALLAMKKRVIKGE
jgi:hypothetical protein